MLSKWTTVYFINKISYYAHYHFSTGGKKTSCNKKIVCERREIRLKHIQYLQKIKKFREGRPIIYTDKTFVHSSHTTPNRCV